MDSANVTETRPAPKRLPAKQHRILESIRDAIVSGRLAPGDQLPTRVQMEEYFNASSVTVQRAINQLLTDGFLVASGRSGTFVTKHPPNLFEYAVVVRGSTPNDLLQTVRDCVVEQAFQISDCRTFNLQVLSGMHDTAAGPAFDQLAASLEGKLLAGIILIGQSPALLDKGVLKDEDIPCACVDFHSWRRGIGTVLLDGTSLITLGLGEVKRRGLRQVAMLLPNGFPLHRPELMELVTERDLRCEPWTIQSQAPSSPHWVEAQVHLMLELPEARRPDALVIADSRMVAPALAAMAERGIKPGRNMLVVARCDLPHSTLLPMGTIGVGYDAWEIIDTAVRTIKQMKQGEVLRQSEKIIARLAE